ncbi:hypothetical protein MSG28_012109 [Choristoneura fumiferana]|uniref:Uncharacterized protein n=1 Tax=Choristoneura fumiferana TaxID=7141 RepID=A0ACC0KCL8_CHOFU|nr:hypothetical protein MSG28_012109 [Choristoneura fumiferana]
MVAINDDDEMSIGLRKWPPERNDYLLPKTALERASCIFVAAIHANYYSKQGSHKTWHGFPNPVTDSERFRTWVYAVGGDILKLKNEYIYKYRCVCHAHFEERFCCRFNKISNIATPTLHMPEKEGEQSSNTTHSDLDKENTGSSVQKLTSCEQRPLRPIENLKIISEMQDVIAEVLKKYLERNNIKEYCKMVITILIDLRDLEGCDEHKSDLKRFILDLVTRFFIYNNCKTLNKIMCGKVAPNDPRDSFQEKAKNVFNKCYRLK